MKKWIRWPGFIVFVTVFVLLAGGSYLFAGSIVKNLIEHSGTDLIGARVELDQVNFSVMPLGFELQNLQVTNPDNPMQNAVQVKRIKFLMSTTELLRLNVVIDEMGVDNVRLNTRRKESGAVSKQAQKAVAPEKSQDLDFSLPKIEFPDVKDILSREKLNTLGLAQEAETELDNARDKWEKNINALPDNNKFQAYEEKIKSIKPVKTGDTVKDIQAISNALGELKKIKKDIKQDISQVKKAKSELRQDTKTLKAQFDHLAKAPADDYARLKEKYSPSSSGVLNISRALFGNTVAYWVNIAVDWYRRLSPVLKNAIEDEDTQSSKQVRHKGIDVRFAENTPSPGFLIKSAHVSLELEVGDISGEINNITSDQEVLGRPLTFSFFADKLKNAGELELVGTFNHTDPGHAVDKVSFRLARYKVKNFILSESDTFPLSLKQAQSDLQAEVQLKENVLMASMLSAVQSAEFVTTWDQKPGSIARSMERALKDVRDFDIKVNISGTKENYDMHVSSDLDEIMKNAIGKQVRQRVDEFEAQLKDRIKEKTTGKIAELKSRFDKVDQLKKKLDKSEKLGNEKLELAENNIDALIKAKKNKLKKKMDNLSDKDQQKIDKLKKKYKNLFK